MRSSNVPSAAWDEGAEGRSGRGLGRGELRHRALARGRLAGGRAPAPPGGRGDVRGEALADPPRGRGLADLLQQRERLLVPRHAVRHARRLQRLAVREVPVVRPAERLRVREPRRPAEQPLGLADVDERVAVGGLVVPLGQRRDAQQLERTQRDLCRASRDRRQPGRRAGVVDQRLQVGANRPELAGRRRSRSRPRPHGRSAASTIASTRSSTASSWYRFSPVPSM